MYYLFREGFEHVNEHKLEPKQFTTLISELGVFYSIEICINKKKRIKICDSLKLIPYSVSDIPKKFGLTVTKGDIDYNKPRPIGYTPTAEEIDYIHRDVLVVAHALEYFFEKNYTKMTIGSNALEDFKKTLHCDFRKIFPILDIDKEIRQAYKGGFTYLKKEYAEVDLPEGIVLDVNSLYPDVLYNCPMPYGEPIFFRGKYKYDEAYPLYIQMLECQFEIKQGHLPTIQLKNSMRHITPEYVESSANESVVLCLTSVDMKLFFSHYNVYDITYISGYKFKANSDIFKPYIDKWMHEKEINDNNVGLRTLAKLFMNNIYGKFSTNPVSQKNIPVYNRHTDEVKYIKSEQEEREPVYIAVGCFVTAWARYKTITTAQRLYHRFIYSDTDSVHLLGTELPDCVNIHPTKLGSFKHEETFQKARYIRAKSYIHMVDGSEHITCAGMPKACHRHVTWDNYHVGLEVKGKLKRKRVSGGVVLSESPHKLKKV